MIVFAGHDRTYSVPASVLASAAQTAGPLSTGRVTAWDLLALSEAGPAREWATKTLTTLIADADSAAEKALDCEECEDTGLFGIEDPTVPDLFTALVQETPSGFRRLTASGWEPYDPPADVEARVLTRDVAADLAAALASGAPGLVLRYVTPIAWLAPTNDSLVIPMTAAAEAAGEEWRSYAIVDELDYGAVLNLIRLARGPKLEAFSSTEGWEPDTALLSSLRSVNPPMLVELDEAATEDVLKQIKASVDPDEDHYEDPEEAGPPTVAAAKAPGLRKNGTPPVCEYCKNTSTGYVLHAEGMAYIPFCDEHKDEAVDAGETSTPDGSRDPSNINRIGEYPVTAASVVSPLPGVSPDPRAEKLRRYWSVGGKGGAKIRWGTPGDWRRCVRHLTKYLGPRAKGYCQNMHKRNTGVWTGSRLNAAATWPTHSVEAMLDSAVGAGGWVLDGETPG